MFSSKTTAQSEQAVCRHAALASASPWRGFSPCMLMKWGVVMVVVPAALPLPWVASAQPCSPRASGDVGRIKGCAQCRRGQHCKGKHRKGFLKRCLRFIAPLFKAGFPCCVLCWGVPTLFPCRASPETHDRVLPLDVVLRSRLILGKKNYMRPHFC